MKKCILGMALLGTLAAASAQTAPFQISLTPEIAMHHQGTRIEGLALSVWGENPQSALALGIVNGSTGNSQGFTWSFLLNYSDDYKGVQWAGVNYNKGNFLGWQSACINYSAGHTKGVQTGFLNYAGDLNGVQFGLLNYAETSAMGVQIGILNLMRETRGWFDDFPDSVAPGMVLVNWRL